MLLITQEDSAVPVFDTTTPHAQVAVDFALAPTPANAEPAEKTPQP